jgi:hypothetical protein
VPLAFTPGLLADLWTLRGASGADADVSGVAWVPLELPGTAPAPRKGAAVAGACALSLAHAHALSSGYRQCWPMFM